MRKVLLTVSLIFASFTNGNAQEFQLGAKAGINFTSVTGDNTSDITSITEFQSFGLVAEIPFSEKLSFQPELMYSAQGFDLNEDLVSLKYLNVPLMAKYYITKRLNIEAGPQFGYLLSAKQEDNDVDDNFNNIDFGVNFGLGYKLENGLNFGARYNLGLSNINDADVLDDKNRNSVFQIYVGFFFL